MADYSYHGVVVVWDLDDTLFRERDYCREGFKLIHDILRDKYGVKHIAGLPLRLDSALRNRRNHFALLENILYKCEPSYSDEKIQTLMNELVGAYRNNPGARISLAPGVREVLDELARRGIVMALVTDGRSGTQRAKIAALGLDRYIPEQNIYISEEAGFDKTSPDNFSAIVREYPEAKRFIYVGDNERKDFMMPNLLGWTTLKAPRNIDNVHEEYVADDILQCPSMKLSSFSELFANI